MKSTGNTSMVTIFHKDGSQQIIRPQMTSSEKDCSFQGDWASLVEAVTGSSRRDGIKNYISFNVS